MHWGLASCGLILAACVANGCSRTATASDSPWLGPPDADQAGRGFAVVELFTSEGCSSCPPADDLMHELAGGARPGAEIDLLEFHVDYWNELGWTDPFSTAWATARQRDYARALHQRGLYTPQMIVNGRDAFVGSDRSQAERAITAALGQSSHLGISLRVTPSARGVGVDLAISGERPTGAILQLALVERDRVSHVKAGENAGRTLHHTNIVRAFEIVSLDRAGRGHTTLSAPAASAGRFSIIAFLQDEKSMSIEAASRADLEP